MFFSCLFCKLKLRIATKSPSIVPDFHFPLFLRSSAVRNQRCPMCGEAPQLQEVENILLFLIDIFSGKKLERRRRLYYIQVGLEIFVAPSTPTILHLHFLTVCCQLASSKHVFQRTVFQNIFFSAEDCYSVLCHKLWMEILH